MKAYTANLIAERDALKAENERLRAEIPKMRGGTVGWYCAKDRYWHKPYEAGKDPLFYMPCPACGGALVPTTTAQVERDEARAALDRVRALCDERDAARLPTVGINGMPFSAMLTTTEVRAILDTPEGKNEGT